MVRPYIDEAKVFSLEDAPRLLEGEELEYFNELVERSREYLTGFNWCDHVTDIKIGLYHPGFLGVFLLEIKTSQPDVDELIWVVMGNLPPAYICGQESDDCPHSISALEGYVWAMYDWVEAVEEGRSVEDVIPVNVSPTKEWAKVLRSKLEFIEEEIFPDYQEFLS